MDWTRKVNPVNVGTATLTTSFPTTNSGVSFYWVDGGAKTVTCSAMCAGITCATNATITVTRPTVSMYSSDTGNWYASGSILWIIYIYFGEKQLSDGMNYFVEINSPVSGAGEFVQVINSYSVNFTQLGTNEADNVVPYGADPANGQPGTYFIPAGGGSDALLELDDAPSTKSYHNSVTLDANYSDYIMFQPTIQNTIFAPLGGNTIYIPLGTVNWAISGTAYWSALYTITIDPKIQYGPSGPDSSTAFPSWVGIFSNQ